MFPYNEYMFNDIVNKAIKQRREMDVPNYQNNHPETAHSTAYYESERLSSIESTTHMT